MEMLMMSIRIWKDGRMYSAEVTPPHCDISWTSPHPMSPQELYNKLLELGCHPVDVLDALTESDPDWQKNAPEFRT